MKGPHTIESVGIAHHSQRGPQQSAASGLGDDSQAQVLQALGGGADKRGGEGGVVSFHHGVARHADAVGGAGVGQLAKVGHHIGHGEGRVWVQGDGRDLKLLIAEAGSVECLQGTEGRRRREEGVSQTDAAKGGRRERNDRKGGK